MSDIGLWLATLAALAFAGFAGVMIYRRRAMAASAGVVLCMAMLFLGLGLRSPELVTWIGFAITGAGGVYLAWRSIAAQR